MGPAFGTLFGMLFAVGVGATIVRLALGRERKPGWLETVCAGFPIGIGLLTLVAFGLDRIGLRLSLWSVGLPWLLLAGYFLFARFRRPETARGGDDPVPRRLPLATLELVFLAAIGLGLAVVWLEALGVTIVEPDAMAFTALKGKAFYLEKTVDSEFLRVAERPGDPINFSLAQTWLYLCSGETEPDDRVVKVLGFAYYACMLGLLYGALRERVGRTYALFFTGLLALTPYLLLRSPVMVADAPLGAYLLGCLAYLLRFIRNGTRWGGLILAALLGGLAAWTQAEGAGYMVVLFGALGVHALAGGFRRAPKRLVAVGAFIAIVVAINLPWQIYKGAQELENDAPYSSSQKMEEGEPARPALLAYYTNEMVVGNRVQGGWGLLWCALGLALVLSPSAFFRDGTWFVTLVLAGCLICILVPFLPAPREIAYPMTGAVERMFLHLLPLALFLLALTCPKETVGGERQAVSGVKKRR